MLHLTAIAYVLSLVSLNNARPTDLFSNNDQKHFNQGKEEPRVNVTLYVMSRCPDARICESVFDEVFQHPGIQDKIDFRLDFIAQPNKSEPLGFSCKHGEQECLGNIQDLCLQRHTPFSQFWPSVQCQNFESPFPGKIGDINLTKRCAETVKVDWWASGVGECIEGKKVKDKTGEDAADGEEEECDVKGNLVGKEGVRLLQDSIRRVKDAGATTSCTIDIGENGKRRCIVDSGNWQGCDDGHAASDFVRVIQEEWKALQR